MDIKLGYSTGVFYAYNIPLKEKVKYILNIQKDAIEVIFQEKKELQEVFNEEFIYMINKFKYRSLHAPVRNVRYPSKKTEWTIHSLLLLVKKLTPNVVVFHPNSIDDFDWLNQEFGSFLAFENTDARTSYGKSTKDLEEVFTKSPQAKWVFDVNHLYTTNKTMSKANQYYQKFKKRFCHYHLSGYGGFHDCLCLTREDIILTGITDYSKPIISEGAAKNMKEIIQQEHRYILKKLEQTHISG